MDPSTPDSFERCIYEEINIYSVAALIFEQIQHHDTLALHVNAMLAAHVDISKPRHHRRIFLTAVPPFNFVY
jgi:hypothetical protein